MLLDLGSTRMRSPRLTGHLNWNPGIPRYFTAVDSPSRNSGGTRSPSKRSRKISKRTPATPRDFTSRVLRLEVGKFQEALDAFDRALVYDPENALVYFQKGRAFDGLGGTRKP